MLTREELTKWYDCNLKSRTFHRDCEKCFLGELNLYNMWSCKYSRKNVADSHLAALDEIERLKAEVAAAKEQATATDDYYALQKDEVEHLKAQLETEKRKTEKAEGYGFYNGLVRGNTTGNLLIPRREPQTGDRGIKA